eukprot:g28451.t1
MSRTGGVLPARSAWGASPPRATASQAARVPTLPAAAFVWPCVTRGSACALMDVLELMAGATRAQTWWSPAPSS